MNNVKMPNILITGTPGVGKSLLSSKLAATLNFNWQDISKIAKDNNFIEEYDDELECPILDEDKLLDFLEPKMKNGGNIIEYHGCDFFPERWFDVVFVVRCDNTILHDRLTARNYNAKKLQSNIECEIFQTLLEEANESYPHEIVNEIRGDTDADLDKNITLISEWLKKWKIDNPNT